MLRFKNDDGSEFTEWEEHEIAELIQLYNEKVSSDCQLPILTSSKKNGIEYQEEHFTGKQRHDIEGYNVLPRNYCTYRNRSDGTDFTFNINKLCDKGIVSKFYPVFKEKDCDLFFLVSLLNNERKTVRKIAYTAKGTGQKVLSITDLRNITVNMPSLPEQQKIAEFLSTIDTVIEKQKETVSAWEERKKGVMQKLFSQEVRFKADDGSEFPEWEEKNVEDVCSVSTGKGNTQDKVDTGAYRFYVRSPIIEHSDSYLFDEEAVITVGDGVGTGKVFHYVKGKYNLHQRCYRMYDFRDVTGKYFYYFFSTNFYRRVKSMSAKTSVDSVRMEMITKMKILVPCLAEQQKIADCLSSFDEVIEKQKATLAAWEELKKGLLQQMFV